MIKLFQSFAGWLKCAEEKKSIAVMLRLILFFFLFWQFVFLLVNLSSSIFSFCCSVLLTRSYQESYSVFLFKHYFLSIFKSQKPLDYWSLTVRETIGALSEEKLDFWQKFSIKTNLFHICDCVVMLNVWLPLDFVHLHQFWWLHQVIPSSALWKGQRRHIIIPKKPGDHLAFQFL